MSKPTIPNVVDQLRLRARQNIEAGAVTAGYSGDRTAVLARLNVALAAEIVCVLRYRRHHFMAHDIHSQVVAQEFLADSNEEQGHADACRRLGQPAAVDATAGRTATAAAALDHGLSGRQLRHQHTSPDAGPLTTPHPQPDGEPR
jgi:hypothetical protein